MKTKAPHYIMLVLLTAALAMACGGESSTPTPTQPSGEAQLSGDQEDSQGEQINIEFLTAWDPAVHPSTRIFIGSLIDALETESNGRIQVERTGPAGVPPFQQLVPLRDGVFDILFTTPAYHSDIIRLGNGSILVPGGIDTRIECGVLDVFDRAYREKAGVAFTYQFPAGVGFYLYLTEKPEGEFSLDGFSVRGTEFYNPVIEGLGGTPVKMSSSEVFSAAQRGIVQGAFYPSYESPYARGWGEVMEYVVRPDLGESANALLMNLNFWNGLSSEDQNFILQLAHEAAIQGRQKIREREQGYWEKLQDQGMEAIELDGATAEEYRGYFFNGIFREFVQEPAPEYAPEIRDALECQRQHATS